MALNDSQALRLFQTIIDNLPNGVSLIDRDLRYVAWNARFVQLLEYPEELFESDTADLFLAARHNAQRRGEDPDQADEKVRALVGLTRQRQSYDFEVTRQDGVVVAVHGQVLPDDSIVSTFTDITQRKRVEDELRRTALYFQTVLDHLPFGVAVTDTQMRIVYWNDRNARLYGFPEGFIREGMPLSAVSRVLAESGYYGAGDPEEQVAKAMEFIGLFQPYERETPRLDGGVMLLRGVPVMIDDEPAGFVHLAEDISERKAYQETLERLATTDHLTGLLNRRGFFAAAEKEIRRAQRFRQPVSLLMLDIDFFKSINDTYGHPLGDEVLRQVGAALGHALRDEDIIGRIGGEEFAVVLVQMALAEAIAIAQRVRQALAAISIDAGKSRFGFTVSIGIAAVAEDVDAIDKLLSAADQGLYEAKRRGRNQVHSIQVDMPDGAAPAAKQ